jgi:hypothetical protein
MAEHQRSSPSELNWDDREFPHQIASWASRELCEMKETVAASKRRLLNQWHYWRKLIAC